MILRCFFHDSCLLDTFKVNCPVSARKMLMLYHIFFITKIKSGYWQKIQSLSQGQPTPLLWPAAVQKPVKGQGSPCCYCQIKFLTKVHAVDSDTCLYYPTYSYLAFFSLPAAFNFFSTRTHSTVSLLTLHTLHSPLFYLSPLLSFMLGNVATLLQCQEELFLAGQLNVRGHNAG